MADFLNEIIFLKRKEAEKKREILSFSGLYKKVKGNNSPLLFSRSIIA